MPSCPGLGKKVDELFPAVVLAVLVLGSPTRSLAQSVGVTVGVTEATVASSHEDTSGGRTGFAGTVFTEIPITPLLSMRPEVGYWQKGTRVTEYNPLALNEDEVVYVTEHERWRYDYVAAGLLLRARWPMSSGPVTALGLLGGPYLSVLSRSELQLEDGSTRELDNVRSEELAIALGAFLELRRVFVEARFIGLGQDASTSSTQTFRHRVFGLLVGVRLW